MPGDGLPTALLLLKDEPGDAADDVLLAALPLVPSRIRRAVINTLVGRGRARSGVELLRLFAQGHPELGPVVAEYAEPLHSPLRSMMAATDPTDRRIAIDFIVAAGDTRSSYLLAEALRHKDKRTREQCAAALLRLTEACLHEQQQIRARAESCTPTSAGHETDGDEGGSMGARLDELAAALGEAIRAWDAHLQPAVLQAALLLMDRTEPALRCKLADAHSRFAQAAVNCLESGHDPRLAGAVLRATAIAELRSAAGNCLVRARQRSFIDAVLAESWLLADPAIEHGCRWVRMDHWDKEWIGSLLHAIPEMAAQGMRLVAAAGGSQNGKYGLYRELLSRGGEGLRRAVFWRLTADPSESSTHLLTALAARHDDELAEAARRECRRRELDSGVIRAAETVSVVMAAHATTPSAGLSHAASTECSPRVRSNSAGPEYLAEPVPAVAPRSIRELLHSPAPLDRILGLQGMNRTADAFEHADTVYRLCSDGDPAVRAAAVAALERLPGPTALRILRQSLNDPESRVQANAIEALDVIGVAERARLVSSKLNSADNRVRANAIKTCLRAEMHQAAEALLDMLNSPSPAHRTAALWVVEQLRLASVRPRLAEMMEQDDDAGVRERARTALRTLSAVRQSAGAGAVG